MLTPILLASLSNMLSETPKVPVIPHKRELLVFPTSSRSNVDLASSLILHYYFPAVPPLLLHKILYSLEVQGNLVYHPIHIHVIIIIFYSHPGCKLKILTPDSKAFFYK